MDINHFKVNRKKLLQIGSFLIAGVSLIGCSHREKSILDRTILHDTVVVTFSDSTKDIARVENALPYQSFVTGKHYGYSKYYSFQDIIQIEDVSNYLTEDDYDKILQSRLYTDDVIEIVNRIIKQEDVVKDFNK